MSEFEVFVKPNLMKNTDEIFVRRYIGNSRSEFLTKGGTEIVTIDEGDYKTDEDVMFALIPRGLLQPLINGLSELGVKSDPESKLEGTLAATRSHLEDMRAIVLHKYKD